MQRAFRQIGGCYQLRRIVMVFAVWAALVAALVGVSDGWKYYHGVKLIVPLVRNQEIRVEVWPVTVLADRFNPRPYASFAFSFDSPNSRWVGIWYQDLPVGIVLRLAAFTVPTWPIMALAATIALLTGSLWVVERRSNPEHRKT